MEKLFSPEQLDALLVVIGPKGWIGVICLICLLGIVVYWALFATIPLQVTATGIINTPSGFFTVRSQITGLVNTLLVGKGDEIQQGAPLVSLDSSLTDTQIATTKREIAILQEQMAQLRKQPQTEQQPFSSELVHELSYERLQTTILALNEANNRLEELENIKKRLLIRAPVAGVVDRLEVGLEDFLTPGMKIAVISQPLQKEETVQIYGFVPAAYRGILHIGMEAQIEITDNASQQDEILWGTVVAISPYDLSSAELSKNIVSQQRLTQINPNNLPIVQIQISPTHAYLRGKQTLQTLLPPLIPGDTCSIRLTLSRKKPIQYLIP